MHNELPVNQKIYDLIVWFIRHLDNYPRARRYTLGSRIEELLYDLLELCIEARYSSDRFEKIQLIRKANSKLEKLRYFVRLSHELQLMSNNQVHFVHTKINEIGLSIGGWLKEVQARKP